MKEKPSEGRIQESVDLANQAIQSTRSPSVKFEIEKKSGDVIVRVIDRETEEVIRQIPPEELLSIRERLVEMRGVIFDRVT